MKTRGYIESDHVQDDVPYQVEEMSHANEVIEVENMISGGVDPPRPSSHDSNGKGTNAKKRRYMVRLLPPRDSLTSSIPSPSSVSIPVRPPDVAPTPSPPPTEARPSSSHVNAHGPSPVPASTPSPSSVDACGPSPVPTSTPSPSPPMGNMSIDKDTVNLAMEDPPLNNCPMVTLINGVFHSSKVATKAATLSIRQQFGQPWPTWGAIPKEHQEHFFQHFKRKLVWRPEEENEIQKAFNSKAFHRLSEMFRDARNENKRPYWIRDHAKKKNWAYEKGGCMHTGGSISLQDHAIRLSEELGQSIYVDEEEFEAKLSQARSDAASSVGESQLTPLDPAEEQRLRSRCWVAVAGPKCKGRLYGTGDLAHTYNCGKGSSSHAEDATEINRLREELRQSKEDMHIFQSVLLQFLPPEARNIINQHQQPHQQHQDQHQDQADDQQVDDQQRHSPDDYFDY
ncbi:hypothetical protein GmHk_04G010385 [Glycine max]|nr:hypothetical protein GmHk_04G010385 [Glycine max]